MSFYIEDFVKRIKRNDTLIFTNENHTSSMMVNLNLLSFYTDFFNSKNDLFVDNTYDLPFDVNIALKALENIHYSFTTILEDRDIFFKMIKAYDYFCIDVEKIYLIILPSLLNYTNKELCTWTKDAIETKTQLALDLINKLYDYNFMHFSCFYPTDKDVILFLLSKKWILNYQINKEIFIQKAHALETNLFNMILNYATIVNEDIIELWKYIHPNFLSKQNLANFSNHELSKFVAEELKHAIHEKFNFFSLKPIITYNRFFFKDHLKYEDLYVGKKVQVMDIKNKWYNAKIDEVDEYINVSFENFSEKYNEKISKKEMFKFLPYDTIKKDNICPCESCIYQIFKNDKNIIV